MKKLDKLMIPYFEIWDNDSMLDALLLITDYINSVVKQQNKIIDLIGDSKKE